MGTLLLIIGIIALIIGVINMFSGGNDWIVFVCGIIVFVCVTIPFKENVNGEYHKNNWLGKIEGKPPMEVIKQPQPDSENTYETSMI